MSSITKKKKNKILKEVGFLIVIVLVLFLASFNIAEFLRPKKVLGAQTQASTSSQNEQAFWTEFLSSNPNYIPGLIEVGDIQKANKVDPNYRAR